MRLTVLVDLLDIPENVKTLILVKIFWKKTREQKNVWKYEIKIKINNPINRYAIKQRSLERINNLIQL